MSPQLIAALVTGITFLVALLVIGCYIAFRENPKPIPVEAMFIFRVILSLAAAGVGQLGRGHDLANIRIFPGVFLDRRNS